MALNIKNERVHALAREAARVTGGSQTSAIEQALELLLREHGVDAQATEREQRLARILEMGTRFREQERVPGRGVTRAEDLYDETTGMPR